MSFGFDPFEEREPPPMSAAMFTTLVVARLRTVADIVIESQQPLELNLRVRGEPSVVRLDSGYARYRAQPDGLTPIVRQLIESLARGESSDQTVDEFEQVAPHLFPLLISAGEWSKKQEAGVRLVVRPLVQDLGVALVIDRPDARVYVQLDAIPRWGVEITFAYDTALANLERTAGEGSFTQFGDGAGTLLIDRGVDGFAATRLLLPSRREDWSGRVAGALVLGLPYRDFLVGFGRKHPNLAALRAQVEEDWRRHEHALIPQLLVQRAGELRILEADAEGAGV